MQPKKFIPKIVFQLIAFGTLIPVIALTAYWGINDTGAYRPIREFLDFMEDTEVASLLAALLAFFVLFIPWLIVMLFIRQYAQGMATMADEFAYLRGEKPTPELFQDPASKLMFQGAIALLTGVILIIVNAIVWVTVEDGFIGLWLAVPISFCMGIYYLIRGWMMKRSVR